MDLLPHTFAERESGITEAQYRYDCLVYLPLDPKENSKRGSEHACTMESEENQPLALAAILTLY